MDRKCGGISFAGTGHSEHLRLAFKFDNKKLLNPANQADPFYVVIN
jgi:hypothetical protein